VSTEARREIFARIRGSSKLPSARDTAAELSSLGRAPAPNPLDSNLTLAFLAQVIRNGGTIDCVGSRSEAVQTIGTYVYRQHQTHKLIAGNDPRLAALPWRDGKVLPRFDVASGDDLCGLSYARLAIAEAGTTVTFTGRRNPSHNSLLVEDHLVLVDQEDIVENYEQAWSSIHAMAEQEGRPRGINFVAGPSWTADIAGHAVKGAHGPIRWHVIVIGPALGSNSITKAQSIAANPPPQ